MNRPSPRRHPWLFLTLFAVVTLALAPLRAADAPTARIRTELASKDAPWVGQQVTLAVTLLAVGYYDGPTTFELPSVPGLVLLPPASHALVGTEEIDGVSYTTQRHELSVLARRAGDFTVPAFTVRFSVKAQPLDKQAAPGELKTDPVTFSAKLPPGAEKLGELVSARGLVAEEKWSPAPGAAAHTGDAFTRTLTFRAAGVPGMAFPPFVAGKIPGLGVYPKPPRVHDTADRGDITGERIETVAYVCEQPGRVTIPAARFTWWDLNAQKLRTVDFPARTLDIALDPASAHRLAVEQRRARLADALPWLGGAALVLAASWLAWRLGAGAALRRALAEFRPVRLAPLNPPPSPPSEKP